jgi:23S rRNA (cytosine1962-C5)-methyltransferase
MEEYQKVIFSAAAKSRRNVSILGKFHQPSDHPVSIFAPETEYLKGILLFVD